MSSEQRKDLQALIDTLNNDQARGELIARLRTLVEPQNNATPQSTDRKDWLSGVAESLGAFSTSVILVLAGEMEHLPDQIQTILQNLSDPAVINRIGWMLATIAAILVAALLAEWLTKRLLAPFRRAVEARSISNRLVDRGVLLGIGTVLDVLPIVAFAAVAFGILALVETSFLIRLAVLAVINAIVLSRAIIAIGRMVLVPDIPGLRLFPMKDESAAYSFVWLKRFTYTAVYGYFLLHAAWLLALPYAAYVFLSHLLALLIAGMSIVFILQIRGAVAGKLRGPEVPAVGFARLRNQAADFWHILVIAYVVAVYFVWALNLPGGFAFLARASFLSVLAVILARVVMLGAMRLFDTIFTLNDETRRRYPLLEARANRYLPGLRKVLRGAVIAVCALVLLQIWGGEPFQWFASPNGQHTLGRLISIAIVGVAALVAWEVGTIFAERLALRNPGSSRLSTLLPFLQNAFRVVLLTIAVLIVLSEIGVNIAPLLAGAGVVGLAVGFGAQTLVKDIITGIFILTENTISVGDVIEVGSHSGLVEKISIRTVHLRDFDGNLHSIPFGEVQTVKNMSKLFAYAVVDVTVSYRENIDEALAVMAEVGNDMVKDGPLASTIIAPFEVIGVEGLQDSAVWLRGRFKTRPLGQWNVKREFYRRIKAAFDARGIEIPFPHRTIYLGTDKKGSAPPLHVVNQNTATGQRRDAETKAAKTARAAKAAGPVVEEHPGAREHSEANEDELT
ncbi:mechanosensitive ion channel domain-containing protein [Pseudorhodoplanes sinuspersici]|nr:mechanosensitive ion channel domain-containing protein [Pseudorhodoplanes sinuspersici]